jgi:hypothetical protein
MQTILVKIIRHATASRLRSASAVSRTYKEIWGDKVPQKKQTKDQTINNIVPHRIDFEKGFLPSRQ